MIERGRKRWTWRIGSWREPSLLPRHGGSRWATERIGPGPPHPPDRWRKKQRRRDSSGGRKGRVWRQGMGGGRRAVDPDEHWSVSTAIPRDSPLPFSKESSRAEGWKREDATLKKIYLQTKNRQLSPLDRDQTDSIYGEACFPLIFDLAWKALHGHFDLFFFTINVIEWNFLP